MRRLPMLVAVMMIVVFALVLADTPRVEIVKAPVTWEQVALADGKDLYSELCASCHGARADGKGPAAKAFSVPVPDLTRLALSNDGVFPAARVQRTIAGEGKLVAHGSREMPVWGTVLRDVRPDFNSVRREGFARRRIYDLSAYLETIQVR